ncbi:ribonuclease III [bacterium]|nr:ribonuclease III [bacterium]
MRIFSRKSSHQPERSELELMELLNHQFNNLGILQHALRHRSVVLENGGSYDQSNETLEFLGDAVLGLVVVEHLFREFPDKTEGDLSKVKSHVVSGKVLQEIARNMNLGSYILMSRNEAKNGGRDRSSILEDTLEAIIGALYLDGGLEVARDFIHNRIISDIDDLIAGKLDRNYKSQLLEYVQGIGLSSPVYNVISEEGPDHKKRFEIEVRVQNKPLGIGSGRSKKAAQQQAAREAVKHLDDSDDIMSMQGI